MKMIRATFVAIFLLTLAWAPAVQAQNETNRQTVSFSDPSRPGRLVVRAVNGTISIKAYDGKVVTVESSGPRMFEIQGRSNTDPAEIAGLRRIDNSGGNVGVDESNNTISIQARRGGVSELRIQVPVRTNITVNSNQGKTTIEGVDGEIEVNGSNGDIVLTDISGSVVAHSNQGKITGSIRRLTPQKPISFVTNSGVVDVTLPPDAKANIKARTLDGEIYTGFLATELSLQPSSGGSTSGNRAEADSARVREEAARARNSISVFRGGNAAGVFVDALPFHFDIDRSANGALNGGGPDFEFRTLHGNIYIRKRK